MAEKVGARLNITSLDSEKTDCPEVTIATTPQEVQVQDDYFSTSATLKVTLLGDEWNSSAGGLSTLNRELAIHLAKHRKVDVTLLVPEGACKHEEKTAAQSYGIAVVDAKERPGYDPLDWLTFPPEDLSVDVVVGHGVKLGRQGQIIRKSHRFNNNCKWVQVVHTAPEDLSKFKKYPDPILKGERKHQVEVDLCKLADLVVPIGPKLEESYSAYLRRSKKDDVFSVTPGLFDREFGDLEQAPNETADFKVLIFGRGDDEDFELKGYNIAAEAFTDQRLKQKPYHLIFVGAPDGKQEEVRQKLLRCGIAEEQLTVRKFIQSRDRMKDLLCEIDLAIMPSKSEGFGLVALESLSAGLPILVGNKSGFAKALENVPFGTSCIVYSDDPAKWAEAIEAVRARHGMRLEEIKALRASYEKKFSWKEQCEVLVEKMWSMFHGSPKDSVKMPNVGHSSEQLSFSEKGPMLGEEKEAFESNEDDALFASKETLQKWSKPSILESSPADKVSLILKLKVTPQDLNGEQQQIFNEYFKQYIDLYMKNNTIYPTDEPCEGVAVFFKQLEKFHNVLVKTLRLGCLEIVVQCPTLRSHQSLLNDCSSGHFNEVAERCLVTDELKRKLNLETLRFKTTIEEEDYFISKKALLAKTRLAGSTDISARQTEPDEGEDASWSYETSYSPKDSRGALHKASIRGQYETVKMLLECGEDVDQRDQFSLTPLHLACWYGQESVVKLLLEHGANVNATDKFHRTPLQKTERCDNHSIKQLLLRSHAKPSYQQPLSLKTLAQKSFLQVDRRSGFNVLQAAVFEGKYSIVFKAHVLLNRFVNEMEFGTTGKDAKIFPEKTAVDILSSLEEKGPGHAHIDELYKETAKKTNTLKELHRCRCGDDVEKAVELVLNNGVEIDIPALSNRTPLLLSCPSASSNFIKTLIDLGANVNAQRTDGKATPLILAANWNQYTNTRLLLEHGADVNIQDDNGDAPLHVSVREGFFKLSQLLIEVGCNINARNKNDRTPLFIAVENINEQLIKLLLESNADVRMGYKQDPKGRIYLVSGKDRGRSTRYCVMLKKHSLGLFFKRTKGGSLNVADFGTILKSGWEDNPPKNTGEKTLLHVAGRNDNTEIIDLLVKYGADVNARDEDGFTPLHVAAIHGNMQVVKKLVGIGADVNLTTTDGKDAVDLAHLNEEAEIEEYLKSKMASSQRTKEKEVGGGAVLRKMLTEAYSLGSLEHLCSLREYLKSLKF